MNEFIKTSEKLKSETRVLTGAEKAAVLLGELGVSVSYPILKSLNLTETQLRKLNNAFSLMPPYNAENPVLVKRELSVLNELYNYGRMKGLCKEIERKKPPKNSVLPEAADPDKVARIISGWIKDDIK